MAKIIKDDLQRQIEMSENASKSVEAYNALLKETREMLLNIQYVKKQNKNIDDEISRLQQLFNEGEKKNSKISEAAHKKNKKKLDGFKALLESQTQLLSEAEKEADIRGGALENVNKTNLALITTRKLSKQLGKLALQQRGYLYEQQKSVKETELSMGILSKQSNGFRNNIYKTSIVTNELGIGTKEIGRLQGAYSDNVGRAVQLSEEQIVAVSELAKGTMLGVEGAAEFAANMESFNISAKGSAKFIEGVLDTSHKLGVNANKVIKNIQKNIGLLNKYNFKGGVKGLGKMAVLATKFKFEMQSIADFAEKLITPEGAVEAAARLQVLGGEWAKLGDPFELMYRSRNDLAGLTEDIINATTATARFDKASGEIRIDPMEMHRLREVANATGLSYDSLAESARLAAKFSHIEGKISSMFSKEDKEYLSSMAQFNEKTGEFDITMVTKDGTVTESINALRKITPAIVASQIKQQEGLNERAKQALTFNETWENLKNTFKSLLLPGFEAFTKALQNSVGDFHKWAIDTGAFDTLAKLGKQLGEFVAKNPIKIGIGLLIGKASVWILRGKALGFGFNSVASRGGGLGGGAGSFNNTATRGGYTRGAGGRLTKMSRMDKMRGRGGTFRRGGAGSIGASVGLGVGGMALDYGRSQMAEPDSDWGKAAGVTSMALQGAAIGMLFSPIGAGIGALLGGLYGAYNEFGKVEANLSASNNANTNSQNSQNSNPIQSNVSNYTNNTNYNNSSMFQDFISRPGENPVSFSSNDTLVGAKKDGPIDKMLNQEKSASTGSGTGSGKVSVDFKHPLKIDGKIEVSNNGNKSEIDMSDPILMRELAKMIQIELSKAISGGKGVSSPIIFS